MKIMMTRKMLLGLLFFVIAIFAVASVSAYIVDSPRMYDKVVDGLSLWPNPASNTVAKSSNGTLYAMTVEPRDDDYQYDDYLRLYSSIDGYNWTHIQNFKGSMASTCMAINSTGDLHILTRETNSYLSYIVFNLTTLTNTTYWKDCIGSVGGVNARMEINSTDGIRAVYSNGSRQGIYFFNNTTFDYMAIPGTSDQKSAAITIAENNSMYFGGYNGVAGEVGFWCWDDENATLVDLGSVTVDASGVIACSDIFVNNTTIAAIAWKAGGNLKLIYSDLPAISWTVENRILDGRWFFHMNGSRLELTGPVTETAWNPKYWNTSYLNAGTWTEIRNVTLIDPDEEAMLTAPYFSIRRNRFHEPDFWSSIVDMKFYVNLDLLYVGWEAWGQLYPNAAPSFLNLTVDTTYNETYLVNIDPKDLNPQDNVTSVLQDMNAEDDWLDYTGGVLSGTTGETSYGNTTVWVEISFDDGTTNFTYNFTFNSERIQLLYTTSLPHGYLNIHYRGTIRVVDNTTWYAVTNAGWASVDNTTGEITGYPSSRGDFWFHIYLDDINSNNTDDWNITVVIGISPGDTASQITELIVPILIAVAGLVIVVAVLLGVFGSLGSTFNRFGKS